ncbi:MAG: bifunctional phosphoribosylaminoimidazolecarboxamide formyltransferase/IMP cyclohydrolase [Planctomycetota bacterium]
MTEPRIRKALISVNDKTELVPFARALISNDIEIVSTGGTARALREANIPVTPIEELTGFPEILSGRVKTLHPKVHGGLLGVRDDDEHRAQMAEHAIGPIDLVCISLYPFERTVADPSVVEAEAIEQIDIGGPAMIRSAAKNFRFVTVVTAPRQYDRVINDLRSGEGATALRTRAEFAAAAFARTSEYDAAIAAYLGRRSPVAFAQIMQHGYVKVQDLRYGENPHQQAALYRDPASTGQSIVNAEQHHGKALSYNNILDASAALETVKALRRVEPDRPGACVVKHTNPSGVAIADTPRAAAVGAIAGDSIAAYGGILAINTRVDADAAEAIADRTHFFEVIIAPSYEPDALDRLAARWANVRLLATGDRKPSAARKLEHRSIPGGLLVQDRDVKISSSQEWSHAAGPEPTQDQLDALRVLNVACRALSSNAIAIGGRDALGTLRLFGAGAGQMDRLNACRIAIDKSGGACVGAVAASDAFFPFDDGPKRLIEGGITAILHPGGSKRDQDTFDLCNERGVVCLTTGVRHFRH